jgi:putative ABC transport system permease protein
MAFSFLLWQYVQDQVSYDRHYAKADRIYRINADFNMNEKRDIYSNAPRPVAPTLKTQFPEVEDAVRVLGIGGLNIHTATLVLDDVNIKTKQIFMVDSTFFNMFEQEFIIGNPENALKEPNSIVLSQSLAEKFFGDQEAYGKSLELPGRDSKNLKITGIIKDPSSNTHLQMEALVSWTTFPYEREMSQWYGAHTYTYILLHESNDPVALHDKFPDFFEQHMKETFEDLQGSADLIFQPLTEIHLGPEYVWEPYAHGSATNVSILSIIIIFLLVLAGINYVNLATAYATERASEVGMRKVLGSSRISLLIQFLGESILITMLSGMAAIILAIFLLPYFNYIANLNQSLDALLNISNISSIMLLSLAIGILAGIYPAIHLSAIDSITVLKSKYGNNGKGNNLRKLLVIIQYTIAAMLIAGILFVSEQTRFIKNKDVGFEKENLIHLSIPEDTSVVNRLEIFKELLIGHTNIVGATSSRYSLDTEANQFTPTLESLDGTTFQMGTDLISIDHEFVNTLGLKIVNGRNFNIDSGSDEDFSILINQTAVRRFGWEENPLLGKMPLGEDEQGNPITYSVIGVVNDFNLGVSYQEINPLIMFLDTEGSQNLYLKTKGGNLMESISFVKETWHATFPDHSLEYSFVDESLDKLYKKEEQFLSLLRSFSFIIIFIASLGIIGLISFTTRLKKKEIAIRKVNGASPMTIISLLSKKIAGLILIANLIAIPFTYFFIQVWLENFAHRIDLNIWPFVIALCICAFFTAIALLYHTSKAALANPIYALHDD